MKLLVDSCVARAVVERLRHDGHDVLAMRENPPDPGDRAILALAAREARAIVTIDSDFGALVFRDRETRVGVLRLRERRAGLLADRAAELVARHGGDLEAGAFVTDDGDSARVSPSP